MQRALIRHCLKAVGLLAALALSPTALALEGFPPSVSLPKDVKVKNERTTNYDQATFQLKGKPVIKVGKVVTAFLSFVPEGHRPAAATWTAWKPLLEKAGWQGAGDSDATHTLTRKDGSVESLLEVALNDYDDPKLTLLVAQGAAPKLNLPAPAPGPKSEKVSETQDYPYLPAYPGAKLHATVVQDPAPFLVKFPGLADVTVVASSYIQKHYTPPPTLSAYELDVTMRDALARAGWEVMPPDDAEHSNGSVVAHYTKNSREIWVWLQRAADDSDQGLVYTVADVGGEDWSKALQQNCRLTLQGVNFDFNKATLRPESNGILEKAATTLKALPKLKIEVQGHTDNVGDDDYNAKLSTSRAEAVRAWLVGHGIPADRLSSKGYGKTVPIASNDSDAGRAQNRRVDLACAK